MIHTQSSEPQLQYDQDPPKRDFIGKRFGRVLVVRFLGWKPVDYKWTPRLPMWECQCDCGNTWITKGHTFSKAARTTLSCGCFRAEVSAAVCRGRSKPFGESYKNFVVGRVRAGAKIRDLPFTLTTGEAVGLMTQACHYCGDPPSELRKSQSDAVNRGAFLTGGIDRVDNALGYVPGNVVPSCFLCNIMKGNKTTKEFLAHIAKIYGRTRAT